MTCLLPSPRPPRLGQGVVEVVKECAEEFMSDRRIFAIVEGLLEDGLLESVGPIASEVYQNAVVRPRRCNFVS